MTKAKAALRKSILIGSMALALTVPGVVRADNSAPHRKPDVKAWKADQASGRSARENNDLPEAEKCFKAALEEAENFDAKDVRLAESLKDLGEVFLAEKKSAECEQLLRRATEVVHGSSQPQVEIGYLLEYAIVCSQLKHYEEGVQSFERVQSLAAKHLGRSHPLAVETSLLLAEALVQKGDYAQAEPLLKRSFELFRNPTAKTIMTRPANGAIYGRDIRQIHYRLNYAYALEAASKLNFVYLKENKPGEAAGILKQSLELIDSNASTADPVYPEILYEMGLAYVVNGNLEASKSAFDRLLVLVGKAKGPAKSAAFDAATRLQNSLADALVKQQKADDAEILFTSLSGAADKNFGPDSRESDVVLSNLAQYYLDHGQFEKALPLFQRQLAHAEKYQPDGAALAPILTGLETIYSHLGRDAELDEIYQKQIRVYEKVFGPNSSGLVKPLTARAALLRKSHRDAEAGPLEARASAISGTPKK